MTGPSTESFVRIFRSLLFARQRPTSSDLMCSMASTTKRVERDHPAAEQKQYARMGRRHRRVDNDVDCRRRRLFEAELGCASRRYASAIKEDSPGTRVGNDEMGQRTF